MTARKVLKIRTQAIDAWHRKDMALVIALFTSIADHLTDSDKLKLRYAKRHSPD